MYSQNVSVQIICQELVADQWMQLRDLRLASLVDSPTAFGGNFEIESAMDEAQWRQHFAKLTYVVAQVNGKNIAIMSIEILEGDFGATCWIGGCWSDPEFRGRGAMRAMFNYLDMHASNRGWQIQGLGVWIDNFSAITAYEKLGFVAMGDPQKSTRVPGKLFQRMIRNINAIAIEPKKN